MNNRPEPTRKHVPANNGGEASPHANQITSAHGLLASYPFASATPTSHVARHLSSMTVTAPLPSVAQPHMLTESSFYPPDPSTYTPYSNILEAELPPAGPLRQLWDHQRNEIVHAIGQEGIDIPHTAAPLDNASGPVTLNSQTRWTASSYHASPLSNSVLQSTYHHPRGPPVPPGLVPTPSSLSGALGNPSPQRQRSIRQSNEANKNRVFASSESHDYFENFLSSVARERDVKRPSPPSKSRSSSGSSVSDKKRHPSSSSKAATSSSAPTSSSPLARPAPKEQPKPVLNLKRTLTPPPLSLLPEESPDPLDLLPSRKGTYVEPLTPSRKRKPADSLASPTIKRVNSMNFPSSSGSQRPLSVSSSVSSIHSHFSKNAGKFSTLPSRSRLTPYIELPPVPGRSPSRISSSSSTPTVAQKESRNQSVVTLPTPRGRAASLASSDITEQNHGYDPSDGSDGSDYEGGTFTVDGGTPKMETTAVAAVGSSHRKTKLKVGLDERAPLQKLVAFLEDIYEAEDSLPPEGGLDDADDRVASFFSRLTSDCSRALLSASTVTKLAQLLGQVTRPSKRSRLAAGTRGTAGISAGSGASSGVGRLAELDHQTLSRILRILMRSVEIGEDLDPFVSTLSTKVDGTPIRKKGQKRAKATKRKTEKIASKHRSRSRSKSRTPREEEEEEEMEEEETKASADEEQEADDQDGDAIQEDFSKLDRILEEAKESVLAAGCCLALLGADKLPKQLYSEEIITGCMASIKNQLSRIIYPFIEGSNDVHGHNSPALRHVIKALSTDAVSCRKQIGEIFRLLSAALPRIDSLVSRQSHVAMSDAITIQAVYIAIGPFFVVESASGATGAGRGSKDKEKHSLVLETLGGSTSFKGLRLSALSLIRSIFKSNADQRSWVIEEILTSLIKLPDLKQKAGQFRLRDGRSIHTVSALLLQLIQTSAHDTGLQAARFARTRRELAAKSSMISVQDDSEEFLSELDQEELRAYATALDAPFNVSKTILVYLTQRAGKGKATKTTNESEYRAILDTMVSDLLTVLYWPEWPAAAILLMVVCKLLSHALEDVQSSGAATTDTNGLKSIALDHLGLIAARLRTSQLRVSKAEIETGLAFGTLDALIAKSNIEGVESLISAHLEISTHLVQSSSEDPAANESARELHNVVWAQELGSALTKCDSILSKMTVEGTKGSTEHGIFLQIAKRLKTACRELWKDPSNDVFSAGSDISRIDSVAESLGRSQGLRNAFEPLLATILLSLDASAVFMRTKALRALGQIVLIDPAILRNTNVKQAIENHLSDNSTGVRDAAVELVGKYVVSMPAVAGDYFDQIAQRIADTGLAVRKRVIKLFKSLYLVEKSAERRVDICRRLVLRMLDEDETVKELSVKTLGELWFSGTQPEIELKGVRASSADVVVNESVISKLSIIMGVTDKFSERQSPLEDLLHQLASGSDPSTNLITAQYEELTNSLVDTLIDAQEIPGFTVVNCIRTIYIFSSAHPALLSPSKASILLPYLKNPSNSEEQAVAEYILKIFRLNIPTMPSTATKFGQELQKILQPMILKPSPQGGLMGLQETVACLCMVVKHLTHDFTRLVALLKSCEKQTRLMIDKSAHNTLEASTLRTVIVLVFILSLLCEHCDFDVLRDQNTVVASDLSGFGTNGVTEHVYEIVLTLHGNIEDSTTRNRLMQCLGFLFRSYPTLMTTDESARLMDIVFTSPDLEAKCRLLKIIQDFLMSESAKFSSQEKVPKKTSKKKVSMDELVGNTAGFADSGVSSAVAQRYLSQILEAAVTNHHSVQAAAVDILGFVVRQGLAHPIQCVATLVALETSPSSSLSSRASNYHNILYTKYASMISVRYVECARKSFDYQQKITSDVSGFRMSPNPTALLQTWYNLVRDKRATRQEFLKAIVKALDVDVEIGIDSQDSLDFVRYIMENLSALEYKTQEEVLTVIRHITAIVSVAGVQVIDVLHQQVMIPHDQPRANLAQGNDSAERSEPTSSPAFTFEFSRAAVVVSMLLILKAYLKDVYGLSEDKCMKWIPGKKSAIGDKAATRRREAPLNWDRIRFAVQPLLSTEDAAIQHHDLLQIWEQEGVSPEPTEDIE